MDGRHRHVSAGTESGVSVDSPPHNGLTRAKGHGRTAVTTHDKLAARTTATHHTRSPVEIRVRGTVGAVSRALPRPTSATRSYDAQVRACLCTRGRSR